MLLILVLKVIKPDYLLGENLHQINSLTSQTSAVVIIAVHKDF